MSYYKRNYYKRHIGIQGVGSTDNIVDPLTELMSQTTQDRRVDNILVKPGRKPMGMGLDQL